MDLSVAMKSSSGVLFTMAMSFNNKGPFGGFYRYIGEEDTYKVYRDSMTDSDGNEVVFEDMTAAFDRQDIEFVGAIREGREPESSAASVVPTMALLDKIDKSMTGLRRQSWVRSSQHWAPAIRRICSRGRQTRTPSSSIRLPPPSRSSARHSTRASRT
jgi:hypothetical protein